jgi:mono/diheme cytochrome c family protein
MASFAKYAVMAIVVAGIAIAVWRIAAPSSDAGIVKVSVPTLSSLAMAGEVAFEATCAACHGTNGAGTETGPPLVHDIYNPGHHPDESFYLAARRGTRQHHWSFGNMPPQDHVTDDELLAIVAYVRELQQANGILYQPHRM